MPRLAADDRLEESRALRRRRCRCGSRKRFGHAESMRPEPGPIILLETERLRLRRFVPGDARPCSSSSIRTRT
ncbi:MAG: hypothetical protein MZV70_43225 [Desulfobacterales bacterium]|nr:hypothetical protein [Desulfobacterales bacterium]